MPTRMTKYVFSDRILEDMIPCHLNQLPVLKEYQQLKEEGWWCAQLGIDTFIDCLEEVGFTVDGGYIKL